MNYYLIFAGLLSLLLSVAHAVWGEKTIIKELIGSKRSDLSKTGFRVAWHQITSTLAVSGAGLMLAGAQIWNPAEKIALFILVLMLANIFVFNLIALTKNREIFKQTLPQTIVFLILFGLIIIGIWS